MEKLGTKKCKYCLSDMHEKAVVCPHCGKDQRWWNSWLMFVVYLIIAEFILTLIIPKLFNF